jgi:hypothetical protein
LRNASFTTPNFSRPPTEPAPSWLTDVGAGIFVMPISNSGKTSFYGTPLTILFAAVLAQCLLHNTKLLSIIHWYR